MSKASKARSKQKRKQYKANLKAQKRALYLSLAGSGKKKSDSQKKADPNAYGSIWLKQKGK